MNGNEDLPDDLNELARQAASGDKRALDKLLNHPTFHRMLDIQCKSVWRRNWRNNGARDLNDLKQTTFLRVLCKITQFTGESTLADGSPNPNPLAGWIRTIAQRIHLTEAKREKRRGELLEKNAGKLSPAPCEPAPEMRAALREANQKLGPDERELWDMRLRGFTPQEIVKNLFPAQWKRWDKKRRTNEAKKMSKRVNKIQKKFLPILGIQPPSPRPKKIELPRPKLTRSLKPRKIVKAPRPRRSPLNRLRSFRKASGR